MTSFAGVLLISGLAVVAVGQTKPAGPERFSANANASGPSGAWAAHLQINIERYIAEADRTKITEALKSGDFQTFLTVLRAAPSLGTVTVSDQHFTVRWATQAPAERKYARSIVVVTEKPVYFVGGGAASAKPREGYEVALLRIEIDDAGFGSGSMSAAARLKAGGPNGVEIDDYGAAPIKLTSVTKAITP
jgi:hypothetical protein